MSRPVFYLLAGPNGAGKSTLYRALVRERILAQVNDLKQGIVLGDAQNPITP